MRRDHKLSERVYLELKRDLLAGNLPISRLPISHLALRYHASATPIREALLRLVGEGLVALNPAGGFALPRLSELSSP